MGYSACGKVTQERFPCRFGHVSLQGKDGRAGGTFSPDTQPAASMILDLEPPEL